MSRVAILPRPKFGGGLVSSLCRKNFITVLLSSTVGEALAYVRTTARRGDIFYLYVVDADKKLCGVVSIRNLLVAKDTDAVSAIVTQHPVCVLETEDLTVAYGLFAKSKFLSLPVVNKDGVIQGVLHAHELVDGYPEMQESLFEERSRGHLFELLGVQAEDHKSNAFKIAMGRLPWLLTNILGGALSAVFIHTLGPGLSDSVLYLAFVPVLLIISESIGMQTASIAIGNLNRGASQIRSSSLFSKELFTALLVGLVCALILGGGVHLWLHSTPLTLTVALSVALGSVWTSSLGNIVPVLIHRLKLDPQVSAGPLVLAAADCSTLLLFLLIAFWLNR